MKAMLGNTDFNPEKDIPSLDGKVIFISGGSAGLGAESAKTFAAHSPAHIYISGRNRKAGEAIIAGITSKYPSVGMTFVEIDLSSLESVKEGVKKYFQHDRLDILMCNAGIMAQPAVLSKDGYEIQFATNHLGHAMMIDCLLPTLLRTAKDPTSDVRILNLTSMGYRFHPNGISYNELNTRGTMKRMVLGGWIRYGHSKLANILYATELSRRYPEIKSVAIHPGVVLTDLFYSQTLANRWFISFSCWLQGLKPMEPHQGCWNQVYCAVVTKKEDLVNGGFYYPVGVEKPDMLDKTAANAKLAKELWEWTADVLAKF